MHKVETIFRDGLSLLEAGKYAGAAEVFERVIQLSPQWAPGHTELGIAFFLLDRFPEALEQLRRAVKLDPTASRARLSFGATLHRMNHIEQALPHLRYATDADANSPGAHASLALALFDLRRIDEARKPLLRALELNPERPDAKYLRGAISLISGDFKNGWSDYEFRWITAGKGSSKPVSPGPEWTGEISPGLRILVYPEQGYGDSFQFSRYVPLLANLGMKPRLLCPPGVLPLFRTLRGPIDLIPYGQPVEFDAHCPLLSLPRALGTTLETIPAEVPYLFADPAAAALWKQRLDSLATGRPKIGIVWAGNPDHRNDAVRSTRLAYFSALNSIEADFYALQKGNAAREQRPRGFNIHDLSDQITTFVDTAAIISCLDLVIAVDTSVVHLAGALGKTCWLLLPYAGEWRWLLNRTDSPWYPTMRLFRQPRLGDWPAVFAEVADALKNVDFKSASPSSAPAISTDHTP